MRNYKELLKNITTFLFDHDGVLTDGKIIITGSGEQLRSINIKDGYILQLAKRKGYRVGVISGAFSPIIENRLKKLNIDFIRLGISDKLKCFEEIVAENNLKKEEILYMGDDIPDYLVMKEVGLATCPADAVNEIKEISNYISNFKGGYGCVRDIVEQVLKVNNEWMTDDCFHW